MYIKLYNKYLLSITSNYYNFYLIIRGYICIKNKY